MAIPTDDFEKLRELIKDNSGIDLAPSKAYLVESRLTPVMKERGFGSYRELYENAVLPSNQDLLDALVDAMTTNETLWFRDAGPWQVINETLLPETVERMATGKQRRMRVLCAACSTGQEPYSVGMVITEFLEKNKPKNVTKNAFEIVGVDISPSALFAAMTGRYDQMAASRGLDPERRKKFFEEDGTALVVRPEIRAMVDFRKQNLLDSFASLGKFDLVMCRNVLIYFDNETRKGIVERISGVLNPDGALILGGAESLQGAMRLFKLSRSGTALYYVAKTQSEGRA